MYAFTAFDAFTAAVPTGQLVFDPTPIAFAGLLALAAVVGSALGIAMRAQRTEARPSPRIGRALPHTA